MVCLVALAVGGIVYFSFKLFAPFAGPAYGAQNAFMWLLGLCYALAIVTVGPLAAMSIQSERRQETFELLRLAPFTAGQIALGKILNAVGFYLLLVVAALPVVGVLFFFAGVDLAQFAQVLIIAITSALAVACIGVAASSRFDKRNAAIMMTLVGATLLFGAPQFVLLGIFAVVAATIEDFRLGWFENTVAEPLDRLLNRLEDRFPAVADFVNDGLVPTVEDFAQRMNIDWMDVAGFFAGGNSSIAAIGMILNGYGGWWVVAGSLINHSIIAYIAFRLACSGINASLYAISRGRKIARLLETSVVITPGQLLRAGVRGYELRDGRNPIAWQCLHATKPVNRKFAWAIYILAAGAVFASGYNSFNHEFSRSIDGVLAWCGTLTGVFLLLIPALVSGYVTRDYETGGMDLLRTTLLHPREIVNGRFKATIISIMPFIVLSLIGALPLLYLHHGDTGVNLYPYLAVGYLSMFLCLLFGITAALHFALYTRNARHALGYAYIGTLLVFAGVLFLVFVFTLPWRTQPNEWLMPFLSPFMLFIRDKPGTLNWGTSWFTTTIAYGGISLVLIALSYACYGRKHMRDQ